MLFYSSGPLQIWEETFLGAGRGIIILYLTAVPLSASSIQWTAVCLTFNLREARCWLLPGTRLVQALPSHSIWLRPPHLKQHFLFALVFFLFSIYRDLKSLFPFSCLFLFLLPLECQRPGRGALSGLVHGCIICAQHGLTRRSAWSVCVDECWVRATLGEAQETARGLGSRIIDSGYSF